MEGERTKAGDGRSLMRHEEQGRSCSVWRESVKFFSEKGCERLGNGIS